MDSLQGISGLVYGISPPNHNKQKEAINRRQGFFYSGVQLNEKVGCAINLQPSNREKGIQTLKNLKGRKRKGEGFLKTLES